MSRFDIRAGARKEPAELFCNHCRRKLLYENIAAVGTPYHTIGEVIKNIPTALVRIWQCQNCGKDFVLSLEVDGQGIQIFPERQFNWREPREYEVFADDGIAVLKYGYFNTIEAFNRDIRTICAMGIRSCIEWICVERGARAQNLDEKIKELAGNGSITAGQHQAVDMLRILGNEAAHAMISPDRDELEDGVKILEELIFSIYELPVMVVRRAKERKARKKP